MFDTRKAEGGSFMQKIVIVEDDEKLRKELEAFLSHNGYQVDVITQFKQVVETIMQIQPDLVLLDIQLPSTDGEYLLKQLRKTSEVPVIMITSKDNTVDELLSMNYGADDYVTKPFHIQILLAKIAAILKRVGRAMDNTNRIDAGDFILNISKSRIETAQMKIELTKNELKIMHFLLQKRGEIVSREEMMEYLWDTDSFIDDNTLTVNITRLKNKLAEINLKEMIETRRGQGYLLKEEKEEE